MQRRDFPNQDRLGVVTALVLLVYALIPYTNLPVSELPFEILGVQIAIPLNPYMIVSLLTAAAAASGADWILRDHPRLQESSTLPYIILPALTAWALGFPLGALDPGPVWWAVLVLGAVLIMLVLVGEYTALEPDSYYYPLAQMALTAVACGLLLTVSSAIRFINLRVYSLVGIMAPLTLFFSLRLIHLRIKGWKWEWSCAIMLILTQFAIGLHYWPLSALPTGLILTGLGYALVNWAVTKILGSDVRLAAMESIVVFVFCLILAIISA